MAAEIPIYCINLERAVERKANILREWVDRRGMAINFWKAYDRRDVALGKYHYPHNPAMARRITKRTMSAGEIACATSHGMLCEHLLSLGLTRAIIMEDDVVPMFPDRSTFFSKVSLAAESFPIDVLQLHNPTSKFRAYRQNEHCFLLSKAPWGNRCVYFTRAGLQAMADLLKRGCFIADWTWNHYFTRRRLIGLIKRPLAFHSLQDTYIGNDKRGSKRRFIE